MLQHPDGLCHPERSEGSVRGCVKAPSFHSLDADDADDADNADKL